jgi:hypothetical protein
MKVFELIKKHIKEFNEKKSLTGNWRLYEYYTEFNGKLLNVKENQIRIKKYFWDIVFFENGNLKNSSNLDVPFVKHIDANSWGKTRNYVRFQNLDDFRKQIEFQFAFEKENLKLLKKDEFGNIEIFAFFKKLNV